MLIEVKLKIKEDAFVVNDTRHFAVEQYLEKLLGKVKTIDTYGFSLLDETGNPYHEIKMYLYGILRVRGGFYYIDSKGNKYSLLVVEEGACYLLFEIVGDEALFHGGLSGVEETRFFETREGSSFKYYLRVYHKLFSSEIEAILDPRKEYRYSTAEKAESPRKKGRKK